MFDGPRQTLPRTEGTQQELVNPAARSDHHTFGLYKPGTPVWVSLDRLYLHEPGCPTHVNGAGIHMTGEVRGVLKHWIAEYRGHWIGKVTYETQYADGREPERWVDAPVPDYALRVRETAG